MRVQYLFTGTIKVSEKFIDISVIFVRYYGHFCGKVSSKLLMINLTTLPHRSCCTNMRFRKLSEQLIMKWSFVKCTLSTLRLSKCCILTCDNMVHYMATSVSRLMNMLAHTNRRHVTYFLTEKIKVLLVELMYCSVCDIVR